MTELRKCGRGHDMPAGAVVCPSCFSDGFLSALKARFGEARRGKRVYAVRAIEKGEVVTVAVTEADAVGMPPSGHLIFATEDNKVVRIYTPSTWLTMRDVSAEGPEAVAAFLAEQEGAGTA